MNSMLGIRRRIKGALRGRQEPSAPSAPKTSRQATAPLAPEPKSNNFSAAARAASRGELSTFEPLTKAEPQVLAGDDEFWGPVDNESSREKQAGKTLDIDQQECIGCGTCVENTEQVFFLNDDECKAHVIAQEGDMYLVQDAIDACPVTCISWL
jgi:ferredoxin